MKHDNDPRVVLSLDAGGTNLKFSAIRGNKLLAAPLFIPSEGDNLERCLAAIRQGFRALEAQSPEPPAAISFAFPGPADYPAGIIGDSVNMMAFHGSGVALGPMLQEEFGLPVYINNDGNLFAYGEAIGGFLPYVNTLLEQGGRPKRYHSLVGVTLGTGFGGGIVIEGRLLIGDNSAGAEVCLLRNRLDPESPAEEGASIRAVRRTYAKEAGVAVADAPEPKVIAEIAQNRAPGNVAAAQEAFRQVGAVVGDALAQALTLVDGVAVIGGGLSGAHALFMPAVMDAMRGVFENGSGALRRRLFAKPYHVDNAGERAAFLTGDVTTISVPGSGREITYDPSQRTAVGLSRLGTSEAVAIGAYAFALAQIDRGD